MMRAAAVPILTAVTDPAWEAALVADLGHVERGVAVVRRCVDVADLLAVAASGVARVAVVSADLRRLDRDALARLSLAEVGVVGVVRPGDEAADRRLRELGVAAVVGTTAAAVEVASAVLAAAAWSAPATGFAAPGRGADQEGSPSGAEPAEWDGGGRDALSSTLPLGGRGRLVTVWGPAGAPGRTSVAIGLAAEFAAQGVAPLLVDADVYGGTVAQQLGMLEETPGLAAACRLANTGMLDVPRLAALARACSDGLRVLPGISRPARWPELRSAAFEAVLALCRSLARVTVVDCGFSLEQDEELIYDTAAPRRNGATLVALTAADMVVAVGSGDPVGVQRLVRGLSELVEVVPGVEPIVVVNRARRTAVGGDPRREVGGALDRYAGVAAAAYVPYDRAAYDTAIAAGRTLREVAPGSAARRALSGLAAELADRMQTGPPTGRAPRRTQPRQTPLPSSR